MLQRTAITAASAIVLVGSLISDAMAQVGDDRALLASVLSAQQQIIAAAQARDGDKLTSIYQTLMAELFVYKRQFGISNELTQNPCQRAYEEVAVSAMYLATYYQPERQISGPVDRAGEGRNADKWWKSHREEMSDCERKLGMEPSVPIGPVSLTAGR